MLPRFPISGSRFTTRTITAAAILLSALASAAAQEQYFEEPPPKPKFSLQWDFLARFDRVDHWKGYPTVDRGRFELRPELGFEPSERLRIAVRGVFDLGTERYAYPEYDNYESRNAELERYYVLWTPSRFAFRAGRFGMPLAATEMVWDRDIQTPGVAAAWDAPGGALTLAAAGFYGPQRDGDESRIAVGQLVGRLGEEGRFRLEVAASYWSYDLRDMAPAYIRQNSSVVVDGRPEFAVGFHVADLLVRARFELLGVPFLVALDGIRNFEAVEGRRHGFDGTLAVGRLGTPGNWRAFYTYQYIQRDATVAAYNGDEWWYHTWYEGHRVGVAFTFLPRVYLQGSFSTQRRLDVDFWLNRYLVDLVKLF